MTAIVKGPKATAKGVVGFTRDYASTFKALEKFKDTLATTDKDTILMAQSFLEKSILSSKIIFEGSHAKTFMEGVAEGQLRRTFFSSTERMDRMIAAHAGLAEARLTIEQFAAGKLRGQNYINARRGLDNMGVDIDKILKRYKATGRLGLSRNELDAVITQSVKQTQFATGVLDVPSQWRTPHGRVLMQFKSFAFNAGKLVRDQVIREFDQGNYKPFLYFMTLGSMTGEAVGLSLDIAKQRPRDVPNGPWRVVEDISNFGGLGLAHSIVQSARYGKLEETVLGVSVSDVAGIGHDLYNFSTTGDPSKLVRTVGRWPVVQAYGHPMAKVGANLLAGSASAISEGWDFGAEEEEERVPGEKTLRDIILENQRR